LLTHLLNPSFIKISNVILLQITPVKKFLKIGPWTERQLAAGFTSSGAEVCGGLVDVSGRGRSGILRSRFRQLHSLTVLQQGELAAMLLNISIFPDDALAKISWGVFQASIKMVSNARRSGKNVNRLQCLPAIFSGGIMSLMIKARGGKELHVPPILSQILDQLMQNRQVFVLKSFFLTG
jgi:hypothetical protein